MKAFVFNFQESKCLFGEPLLDFLRRGFMQIDNRFYRRPTLFRLLLEEFFESLRELFIRVVPEKSASIDKGSDSFLVGILTDDSEKVFDLKTIHFMNEFQSLIDVFLFTLFE